MKTRTIFSAFLTARDALEDRYILHGFARASMEIKVSKFYNELLRRMDERDALVARLALANDKITDLENAAYHHMEMLDE